jgi:hypothetical protein
VSGDLPVVDFLAALVVGLLLSVARGYGDRRGPRGRRESLDMLEKMEEDRTRKRAAYLSLGVLLTGILVRYPV